MGRWAAILVMLGVVVAACGADGVAADGAIQPPPSSPSTSTTTVSSTTTTTTGIAPTERVVIEAFDAGGVGGEGQTVSPLDLVDGTMYLFGEFVPNFTAVPPSPNWAAGAHGDMAVLLEWTGVNGQRPGSLYVMVFDSSTGSVDEAWARLETSIAESLAGLETELIWSERGSGVVDDVIADWRELRTPARVTRPGGWPCVISLPSGCVWTDATARFYVVPLGQSTATIAVYENRCDCEVGPSYSKFARGANELHDWTNLFEELLASMEFET